MAKRESKKSKRLLKKARKESKDNAERNRILATIGLALVAIGSIAVYSVMNEEVVPLSEKCVTHTGLLSHEHTTLEIYINDNPRAIPNDVGIPTEDCMRPIHTHDSSGVMHIEMVDKDDVATLGAFFEVWRGWEVDRNVPEDLRTEPHFSAEGIIWQGTEYLVDDTHELVVTVYEYQNGEWDSGTVTQEYGDLVLGGNFSPDGSGNTDTRIRIEYREK